MTMNVTKRMGGFAVAVVGGLVLAGAATTVFRTQAEEPPPSTSKYPSVAEYLALVTDTTTPAQAEAMSDGVVTLAEYESAIQSFYACVSAAGIEPESEPSAGLRPSTFGYRVGDADGVPDAETVRAAMASIGECRFAHVEDLSVAWAGQQANMPQSVIAESLTHLNECLAGHGLTERFDDRDRLQRAVSDARGAERATHLAFHRAYQSCRTTVYEAVGYELPQ
ncbi:MAG: hypothetical protein ACSLFM_11300 [Tepidiformaceae bacterium]